jgi:hypothetical protein
VQVDYYSSDEVVEVVVGVVVVVIVIVGAEMVVVEVVGVFGVQAVVGLDCCCSQT